MNNKDKTLPVSPQWVWVRMSDGTLRRHYLNIGYVLPLSKKWGKSKQGIKRKR